MERDIHEELIGKKEKYYQIYTGNFAEEEKKEHEWHIVNNAKKRTGV